MDQKAAIDLLCYCLSKESSEIEPSKFYILSDSDWDKIVRLANRQNVIPLLYMCLKRLGQSTAIPINVVQKLQKAYLFNAAKNIYIYHELSKLLRKFQDEGIPVILLKGAHLAKFVYGNIGLRPMVDVDLLVRKKDLSRIEEKITGMGYSLPGDLLDKKFYYKTHFHLQYYNKGKKLLLEIHWNILDDFKLFRPVVGDIWKMARVSQPGNLNTLVMSPEHLLIYGCAHIDKHGYLNKYLWDKPGCVEHLLSDMGGNQLIWFFDIFLINKHYAGRMDWKLVKETCQKWGVEKSVYCTLQIVNRLFQTSIGTDILNKIKKPGIRKYESIIFECMINKWKKKQMGSIFQLIHSKSLAMNSRLQFRLIRLLDLPGYIFPDIELLANYHSISRNLAYIYYPIHVIKILIRVLNNFFEFIYYTLKKFFKSK